ncbi:Aldo/keto reductase [Annulohypoxylon truncatum]|uniref:Aldo/keto reductase n=1 Tax=Annulohypoxylon truncatum TaxID=327061 RepID=UPI00200738E6|nr:Aldo/keto reductase [Annulohypoxylon truncatum]KAI1210423.1 Aldo/keto reductase [Annulohypoxylon truncatum]
MTLCNLRPFNSAPLSLSSIKTSFVPRRNLFPILKYYSKIISSQDCQGSGVRSFAMSTEPAPMPKMLYGTAWKEEKTSEYVYKALKAGFRGIDTAAQPLHYKEPLVGAAVRQAIAEGIVKRSDLFLQTKFTPLSGQDLGDLPYDASAPVVEQVHSSIAYSLRNFHCVDSEEPYIDSLVLHSPLGTFEDTMTVWKTLEMYVPHQIRQLGISNASIRYVNWLCTLPEITVRPACVQHRFYAANLWERDLRAYLRQEGIVFQAYWVLSGNPLLYTFPPLQRVAAHAGVELPIALYSLVLGLGGTAVLDGTTKEAHMKEDLEGTQFVEEWASSERGRDIWSECLDQFKVFIGEHE